MRIPDDITAKHEDRNAGPFDRQALTEAVTEAWDAIQQGSFRKQPQSQQEAIAGKLCELCLMLICEAAFAQREADKYRLLLEAILAEPACRDH